MCNNSYNDCIRDKTMVGSKQTNGLDFRKEKEATVVSTGKGKKVMIMEKSLLVIDADEDIHHI